MDSQKTAEAIRDVAVGTATAGAIGAGAGMFRAWRKRAGRRDETMKEMFHYLMAQTKFMRVQADTEASRCGKCPGLSDADEDKRIKAMADLDAADERVNEYLMGRLA